MDQTTSNLTFSHHYEINKHTAPSHQLSVMDDIQLQTNSCYQITNASRMAGQDILESNYTVHGVDSINQLHQNHAYVSLRESKQKAQRITLQNQPQYQTKNHNTKKYKTKM